MPAKNLYHHSVVEALQRDGWTITHDPLTLTYGGPDLFVDLGAERSTIAAERGTDKIAVEIHSFLAASPMRDLEDVVGQYDVYRTVLAATEPERKLYLAVPRRVNEGLLSEQFGQLVVTSLRLRLVVFDEDREAPLRWIEQS